MSNKCLDLQAVFYRCANVTANKFFVLRDVVFYGRIRSLIERPAFLGKNVSTRQTNCHFVLVDIVAFDLSSQASILRKNSIIDKYTDCLFLPEKSLSVVTYIQSMYGVGSWISLSGNIYKYDEDGTVFGLYKFKSEQALNTQINTQRKFGLHTKKATTSYDTTDTDKAKFSLIPPSVLTLDKNNLPATLVQSSVVCDVVSNSIEADEVLFGHDLDVSDDIVPACVELTDSVDAVLETFKKSVTDKKKRMLSKHSKKDCGDTVVAVTSNTDFSENAEKIAATYGNFSGVYTPDNVSVFAGQHIKIASITLPKCVGELKLKNDMYVRLVGICKQASNKRMQFVESLQAKYGLEDNIHNVYFMQFIESIKRYWNPAEAHFSKNLNTDRYKVKTFYTHYVNRFTADSDKIYSGVSIKEYVWSIFPRVIDYALYGATISDVADGLCLDFINKYFGSFEFFYAFTLAYVLNIDAALMMYIVSCCGLYGLSFSMICNKDPYVLMMFTQRFNFRMAERMAYALGVIGSSEDSVKHREVGLMLQTLYEKLSFSYGTTVVNFGEFCDVPFRLHLKATEYKRMRDKDEQNDYYSGVYLNNRTFASLVVYFGIQQAKIWDIYKQLDWKRSKIRGSSLYVADVSFKGDKFDEVFRNCADLGLIVDYDFKGEAYTTPAWVAERSCYIYSMLYERATNKTVLNFDVAAEGDDALDFAISRFEEESGLVLDDEQRRAVKLLKHGVSCITGISGSGKSTVIKCMLFVIKYISMIFDSAFNTDDIKGDTVRFVANTDAAIQEMYNVFDGNVGTLCSTFGLGKYSDSDVYIASNDVVFADWYIFDEQANLSLDMLFQIVHRMRGIHANFVFVGDACSLPEVSLGLPFYEMLNYLPSVSLSTVKTDKIDKLLAHNIEAVAGTVPQTANELRTGKNFRLIPCADKDISDVVSVIYKYHMGKATAQDIFYFDDVCKYEFGRHEVSDLLMNGVSCSDGDIQVLTSLGTQAFRLDNSMIANITKENKGREIVLHHTNTKFSYHIGDKVIFCDNFPYNTWYAGWVRMNNGDCVFQKTWLNGVSKGDVGEICGLVRGSRCIFVEPKTEAPKGRNISITNPYCDGAFATDKDAMFIVIRIYKAEYNKYFYLLSQARLADDFVIVEDDKAVTPIYLKQPFMGSAFFKPDNCVRVDSVQGIRHKMIIGVVSSKMSVQSKVSRRLLYSYLSSATDYVYLVGSVSKKNNGGLQRLLSNDSVENTLTIGDMLCM